MNNLQEEIEDEITINKCFEELLEEVIQQAGYIDHGFTHDFIHIYHNTKTTLTFAFEKEYQNFLWNFQSVTNGFIKNGGSKKYLRFYTHEKRDKSDTGFPRIYLTVSISLPLLDTTKDYLALLMAIKFEGLN